MKNEIGRTKLSGKQKLLIGVTAAVIVAGTSALTGAYLKNAWQTEPKAEPTGEAAYYGTPAPLKDFQMAQRGEETPKPQEGTVPKGFGIITEDGIPPAVSPSVGAPPTAGGTPETGAVNLETPMLSPEQTPKTEGTIDKIDPREIGVTINDGPEKEYEETSLTIQRTLTAVLDNGDKQMVRLRVPVMYRSRTLRLEGETLAEAQRIQTELKTRATELGTIKKDLERLLGEWNNLVAKSTPSGALLPESPSLPGNQSAGNLNRATDPDMEPGKAISYEIVNP